MIVVNLWFIKHSNGLFHYGMDYAAALSPQVREIWVRNDALARLVAARLPAIPVRVLDATSLLRAAFVLARRRDSLFTPSSHPIAFVPRQTVIVHDSFPFEGRTGRIKRMLFLAGLFASRSVAGYINHADGHEFLKACGLRGDRTRFLPNRIGDARDPAPGPAIMGNPIVVGLFGSDSLKKNYDALFAQAGAIAQLVNVEWRIFGHDNSYTRRLQRDYRSSEIVIVSSDAMTLDQFVDSIDIAVSTATGEGFARPIALSLMRGVPTLLLDTPVFREFYQASARLFPTVTSLVEALAAIEPGQRIERPMLQVEGTLRADFDTAIAWLKRR